MRNLKINSAMKVALVYFLFSVLWIGLSDYILLVIIKDAEIFRKISTIKGTFFVFASSLIIYLLVNREVKNVKEAFQNIQNLKQLDILTKLMNRNSLELEIDRIYDEEIQVSVLMADINGLRTINEVFSNEKGDLLLVRFSELLKNIFPQNSFISRVGGDEFVVILYDCTYTEIESYGKKLLEKVSSHIVDGIHYSVSIGYSSTCSLEHNVYDSFALSEDRMQQHKLLNENSSSNSIILSLKSTLYEKSDETEMHASRMAFMCDKIANDLNLSFSSTNELKLLALLHDIGKIGVDDAILKKNGPLSNEEWDKMKLHPFIGFKMASSTPQLNMIANAILTHHERWDGNGYPKGISGDEIPLNSRILAVVDAFDAMTNDRVYRKAMSLDAAVSEIIKNRGTQFDPKVVDVFLKIIPSI